LFGFGSKLLATGLLNNAFGNIYKIVIGKVFSASILGFYTQGQMFVQNITQGAIGTLESVTYPILSKTNGDSERLKQAYRKIILASSYVIFPSTIGLALVAEPMILTLVGEQWLPTVPFLQILCVSGALYHLHSINLNVLKVVGRSDLFLKLAVIKKINISIAVIIGLQFGILGLLVAKVISSYVALYINMYYTKRFIDYSFGEQLKDLLPVIVHAIPMALGVGMLTYYLDITHYYKLFLSILSGVILYLSTTLYLKSESLVYIKNLLEVRMPILKKYSI